MLSWIELSAAAIRNNHAALRSLAEPAIFAPVLKANAYGHGLKEIFSVVADLRPSWLCVNYLAEAVQLRGFGFKGHILVAGPVLPEHLEGAFKHQIDVTLGSWPVLEAWLVSKDRARAHLKIDTGMARQGFHADDAPKILQQLQKNNAVFTGISTHFANVEDSTDYSYADIQLALFGKACQVFEAAGMNLLRHAASSASAMLLLRSRFDMVRVGIAYYGFWPSQATRISFLQTNRELVDLQPVLSWRTQITGVKGISAGSYVGYGCTYRAVREMRVAVVPVGYYEGYPRNASNHGAYVLVHGQRCPVIGRICMNMMMIDVSHVSEANVGDIVTLIGSDRADSVKAEDLASWSDTIHYEIVTRLHPEIPRRLL